MRKKPSCEKCRKFWKLRNKESNCENCLPEIMPGNEDAIAVYTQVNAQAIYVGMDGIAVDLDFKAVKLVMDLLKVEDQVDCFQKVYRVWHHMNELDNLKKRSKKNG